MAYPQGESVGKAAEFATVGAPYSVSKVVEFASTGQPYGVARAAEFASIGKPSGVSKAAEFLIVDTSHVPGAPPPPPQPGVPVPTGVIANRLRDYAANFPRPLFAGRHPLHLSRATAAAPTAKSAPPPFNPQRRLLQTIRNHFARAPYPGRAPQHFARSYGGGVGLSTRVSLSVLETLQRGDGGARTSALGVQILCEEGGGTAVRASTCDLAVLQSQDDPTFVRASNFAIAVLVPSWALPPVQTFPQLVGLTYTYTKTPKFSTGVGVASSGREVRVSYWSKPQWEWELDYDMLGDGPPWPGTTASDLKTLIGFFLSTAGAGLPFYFQDPDDYQATGQAIGIGDGATVTFPFVRSYGLGAFVGTESVGTVNANAAVTIYVNGVAQTVFVNEALQSTGVTVNTITPCSSYMTFATAPAAGAVITASFQFLYYCRFKDDSYDFEKLAKNIWQAKKLTIFSLRN